jgi:transposase-like protein
MHLQEIPVEQLDVMLASLVEEHGEDGYWLYLEQLRWPLGVACPRCGSEDLLWLEGRRRHHCRGCRYQFRVTARTAFHDSHLSLPKWFLAISLMLSSESGFSAAQLQRILGGSYKSAWFLEHRIRSAMAAGKPEPAGLVAFLPVPRSVLPRNAEPAAADGAAEAPASWPLLRSLIAGVHGNVGTRHLAAYWDEVRWRHRHAGNPDAFRDTVLALLQHPWLPYDVLTGSRSCESSLVTSS